MNASRAAVLVVGVNLIAVWAVAAAGSLAGQPARWAARPGVTLEEGAVGQAQSDLVEATARLRRHGGPPIETGAVARDPFRFGGQTRLAPAGGPPGVAQPPQVVGASPPAPADPELLLQGMAESQDGDSTVRTAILRAEGELVFATVGTILAGRYTVVALFAESAELEDAQTGQRRTLRMK